MILPRFKYHEPENLEEACEILAEFKGEAGLLAGGTDLLVNMKKGIVSPKHILSLGRIGQLKGIGIENARMSIGSCVTAADMAEYSELKHDFMALSMGAARLGSPLIRNLATIGGNIISARPAADMPPPLIAYGAKVVLEKQGEERAIALDDFFRGPGQTVIEPDEIVEKVLLEMPPPYSGSGYVKLGKRKALEISVVNVAAFISLESPDGPIRKARVVLGAVAPVPLRARKAEKVLIGQKAGESLFAKAGDAAAGDSKPIDDFRGSALYRRDMVAVLTKRALDMAFAEAKAREWRRWE
jgi:CO/xanthine dehydrogenase FAD-binding subunit